ncbi:MAG: NAD(P)H-binding protein [Cytophagales bacterium]|nr:NAD(P)H-binding protein [Bernardetiaceae bacterium]MDW8211794.1 NAD(P)H-binding protein [Cytophagales bacterium]
MQTISILGCGWLGKALARQLVEQGYCVKGSTRTSEKLSAIAQQGAQALQVYLPAPQTEPQLRELLSCHWLVVSVPPSHRHKLENHYAKQIDSLVESFQLLENQPKVIYISSTSVYLECNGVVTEESPIKSAQQDEIAYAEEVLRNHCKATVVRCGGLMGYDRIPGKYFIGQVVDTGQIPVNFIHRDDAVALITTIIKRNVVNEIFNAVAPLHPTRQEVYLTNAQKFGWSPPIFVSPSQPKSFKIVSSNKAVEQLGFRFLFPNPMEFYYENSISK